MIVASQAGWARALVVDQSKEGYGKLELKLEG